MKRILEYESETVLPREIAEMLDEWQEPIVEMCREGDKARCFFGVIRKALIVWFADNSSEAP